MRRAHAPILAITAALAAGAIARAQPQPPQPLPAEAHVDRVAIAPRAGVTSITLASGLQVHLRPADAQVIRIAAVLLGPELVEPAQHRGITALVAGSLNMSRWPAWTCRLTPEGLLFTAETAPDNLEAALTALCEILRDPVLDAGRFDSAKSASIKERQGSGREGDRAIADALSRTLIPTLDPRARPGSVEALSAITLADAQAFASSQFAARPVDLAISGGVDAPTALPILRRTLGTLSPARERSLLTDLRDAKRLAATQTTLPGRVPAGSVLMTLALPAPPQSDLRQSRLALVASKLLQNDLSDAIKAAGLRTTLVSTTVMPGRTWPGLGVTIGTLLVTTPADDQAVERLRTIVRDRIAQIHLRGPSVEAFARARQEAIDELAPRIKRDDYWLSALPVSWFLGVPIDELGTAPDMLASFRSTDLVEHVTQWWSTEQVTTLIIRPEAPNP